MERVPFNRPHLVGDELALIAEAVKRGHISGDGTYTKAIHEWLKTKLSIPSALLTHSCTAALEMAAILHDVGPGDEVIMPSYTFVSTANAFVLRGATPVFVDLRPETLNLDERLIERAITPKTKGIVPVHYAGVACRMDQIMDTARSNNLFVVEDAAQGFGSTYKGAPLGTIGSLGTLSFHETKNVISGEGGALLINDARLAERAEIIREKGTDRSKFLRGAVDKYTWVDIGSSYLPSEIVAAFLLAQIRRSDELLEQRLALWNYYNDGFEDAERRGVLRRPQIPADCEHNGHLYYVLMPTASARDRLIEHLQREGIGAIFHYIPLHSSPAGRRFGRSSGSLDITEDLSRRLVRLPMHYGLSVASIHRIVALVDGFASTSFARQS